MNRLFISLIAVLVLGMAAMALANSVTDSAMGGELTQSFAIENMTCAVCPITVKKAMQRVDGVKSVYVDFNSKTAVVVFDSSKTTAEGIAAASTNVGYPATAVE